MTAVNLRRVKMIEQRMTVQAGEPALIIFEVLPPVATVKVTNGKGDCDGMKASALVFDGVQLAASVEHQSDSETVEEFKARLRQ